MSDETADEKGGLPALQNSSEHEELEVDRDSRGKVLRVTERFKDGTRPGDVIAYHRDKDTDEILGRLVRSAVGGAIWQGKPPPRPGPGVKPETVRKHARMALHARIPRLQAIIDSPHSSTKAVIDAMKLLDKISEEPKGRNDAQLPPKPDAPKGVGLPPVQAEGADAEIVEGDFEIVEE